MADFGKDKVATFITPPKTKEAGTDSRESEKNSDFRIGKTTGDRYQIFFREVPFRDSIATERGAIEIKYLLEQAMVTYESCKAREDLKKSCKFEAQNLDILGSNLLIDNGKWLFRTAEKAMDMDKYEKALSLFIEKKEKSRFIENEDLYGFVNRLAQDLNKMTNMPKTWIVPPDADIASVK